MDEDIKRAEFLDGLNKILNEGKTMVKKQKITWDVKLVRALKRSFIFFSGYITSIFIISMVFNTFFTKTLLDWVAMIIAGIMLNGIWQVYKWDG